MSQYHPPSYTRFKAQQPPAEASSSTSIPRNSLLLSSHSRSLDEDDLSFSIAPRRTPSRPPQLSTSTSSYQHTNSSSSYYQQSQSQAWSMVLSAPLQPPLNPSSTAPSASPPSLMPMPSHDGLGNFASPSGMGTTNSRSLWEEDSFSGTETDLGGGGWSQLSMSGGEDLDAASSSSGSSGAGRRRDYREKRTRERAGSSSTMSITSSLLDTEGLSEMSLSPPSLDVPVDDDPQRTTSMSRVPTLLALHQQPSSTLPISRPYHRPQQPLSVPPLQPHSQARTLIDSERFELLLSLSPSAISAGIRPLLLPPSSTPILPPLSLASSTLLGPSKSSCFVPPIILSLLSLDMDSELLSLLHHNPSTTSTQVPLWHALFLTPNSQDSSSNSSPNESLSLEALFERVRRAGRTSLNFGRRLGEGEDVREEEEEEGFVLGRWKWREGWRGLVVGWTG